MMKSASAKVSLLVSCAAAICCAISVSVFPAAHGSLPLLSLDDLALEVGSSCTEVPNVAINGDCVDDPYRCKNQTESSDCTVERDPCNDPTLKQVCGCSENYDVLVNDSCDKRNKWECNWDSSATPKCSQGTSLGDEFCGDGKLVSGSC
jgi:hypothetical protein